MADPDHLRRQLMVAAGLASLASHAALAAPQPLLIGLTAEFGVQGSHAAQSIEKGILLALDEINAGGGLLGGRPLQLVSRDDRGVPARGVDNFRDFAERSEVLGVFCGRFSPVALEIAPLAAEKGLLLLDPWSAADDITKPPAQGASYTFRLSLTDSWAMAKMVDHAVSRGYRRLAVLLPNTAWGRSCEAALLRHAARQPALQSQTYWYNWGETDFADRLAQVRASRGDALLTVTNEFEGLHMLRQMAAFPAAARLPIISHWGLLGGDFGTTAREYLDQLDFSVVYTFSFSDPQSPRARAVAAGMQRLFKMDVASLRAQVGFAHAYDLTHLLARAISKAGRADRAAVRDALEKLGPHEGLVAQYQRPFTATRHEALWPEIVRLGRFDAAGNVRSVVVRR